MELRGRTSWAAQINVLRPIASCKNTRQTRNGSEARRAPCVGQVTNSCGFKRQSESTIETDSNMEKKMSITKQDLESADKAVEQKSRKMANLSSRIDPLLVS